MTKEQTNTNPMKPDDKTNTIGNNEKANTVQE